MNAIVVRSTFKMSSFSKLKLKLDLNKKLRIRLNSDIQKAEDEFVLLTEELKGRIE